MNPEQLVSDLNRLASSIDASTTPCLNRDRSTLESGPTKVKFIGAGQHKASSTNEVYVVMDSYSL